MKAATTKQTFQCKRICSISFQQQSQREITPTRNICSENSALHTGEGMKCQNFSYVLQDVLQATRKQSATDSTHHPKGRAQVNVTQTQCSDGRQSGTIQDHTNQLIGDIWMILAGHSVTDGRFHQTRQRGQHVDWRIDLKMKWHFTECADSW